MKYCGELLQKIKRPGCDSLDSHTGLPSPSSIMIETHSATLSRMLEPMTQATNPETIVDRARRAGLARWKLETLTGMIGIHSLMSHKRMSEANQEAENRWTRKNVWGEDTKPADDEMGDIILGDNIHPAPVVVQGGGNDLAKLLAVAGMAAGIPLAGIAGYLLSQKPAPQPVVSEPETTTIERDYQIGEVLVE
jgi:hypothetical protein